MMTQVTFKADVRVYGEQEPFAKEGTVWILCDDCYRLQASEYLKHATSNDFEVTSVPDQKCTRCGREPKVTRPIKHFRVFSTREQRIPTADPIQTPRQEYTDISLRIEDQTWDLNKPAHTRLTSSFGTLLALHCIGDVHVRICDDLVAQAAEMGLCHRGFTEESHILIMPANDQTRTLLRYCGIEIVQELGEVSSLESYFMLGNKKIWLGDNARMFLINGSGSPDQSTDQPYSEMTYEVFEIHLQFE